MLLSTGRHCHTVQAALKTYSASAPSWADNSCQVCMVAKWHPWPTRSSLHRFFRDELKSLSFLREIRSCQPNCDSPDRCLNLGNAIREVSLNISAHYLTITSEKMKGWNTQWNSLIILMEDILARLRVGISGLLLHVGNKAVLYHTGVLF